jgi:hypothetical protein
MIKEQTQTTSNILPKTLKLSEYHIKRFSLIKKVVFEKILEVLNKSITAGKDTSKGKKFIPLFIKPKNRYEKFSRLYFLDANNNFIIKFFMFENKVCEINTPIDLKEILGEQDEKSLSEDMLKDFENKEFKKNCLFYFTCIINNLEHNYAEQYFQLNDENFAILTSTYPTNNLIRMIDELIYFKHLENKPLLVNDKIIKEITVFNRVFIRLNDGKNNNINNSTSIKKVEEKRLEQENSIGNNTTNNDSGVINSKTKKAVKKKKNKAQKSDDEEEDDDTNNNEKKISGKKEEKENFSNINSKHLSVNVIESVKKDDTCKSIF